MCICIYYKQYPCFVIAEWAVSSPRTAGRNGEVRFGLCPYMLYSQQTTFSTYQTVRRCQLIRSKSQQSQRKQHVLNRNSTWILWSMRVHTMYSPNVQKESCLVVLSHMHPSILRFSATLNIFRSHVWLLFAFLFFSPSSPPKRCRMEEHQQTRCQVRPEISKVSVRSVLSVLCFALIHWKSESCTTSSIRCHCSSWKSTWRTSLCTYTTRAPKGYLLSSLDCWRICPGTGYSLHGIIAGSKHWAANFLYSAVTE